MEINATHLRIKSKPCQISKLDDYVRQIMIACRIKEELYPNILISLTEAVNNAIIHGNKKDETKFVKIECQEHQKSIVLRIVDEGKGFNLTALKDPLSPERIEMCGGRGVLIMNELCDKVQYQNNGSTVEIHFKRV